MIEYVIALIIFVLSLAIISILCALINNHFVKKLRFKFTKEYNQAVIINYIFSIYDRYKTLIGNREMLDDIEYDFLRIYFRDVSKLVEHIDVFNLEQTIDSIFIKKGNCTSTEKLFFSRLNTVSNNILDLVSMKNNLITMILCHKLDIFNAYELIHKQKETMQKIINSLTKKYKNDNLVLKSKAKNNERNKEYFDYLKKDISSPSYNLGKSLVVT